MVVSRGRSVGHNLSAIGSRTSRKSLPANRSLPLTHVTKIPGPCIVVLEIFVPSALNLFRAPPCFPVCFLFASDIPESAFSGDGESCWLLGAPVEPAPQTQPKRAEDAPEIEVIEPQDDHAEGSDDGYDTDRPPAFPAINSIQRASASSKGQPSSTSRGLMAPPPPRLSAPSSSASTNLAPLTTTKVVKKSRKVALAPGHSTLDWANLKSSGKDLRGGVTQLLRVTPSMLKEHNKKDDAWSAFGGKVYNITPYIPFHPGGEKELLRVAGRDGTKLFALTHAWVSVDMMLDSCLVGLLVPE